MVPDVSVPFRWRLLALFAAALIVRLLWVVSEPATYPVADETMWLSWGLHTLPSPEVHFSPLALRFIFHPPLYIYFIGVLQALFGTLTAVKIGQCLLGASLVPALALIGRRVSGEATGITAAAIAAFYPELVWFSSHFWAETLFTVLLWWAFERLTAADEARSTRAAAAAGVLLGLAVLTRETVLYFVPFAALWLAGRQAGSPAERGFSRAGLRRGALLVATCLLVVLPWTVRNALVFDAFVPVSTAGALNLWQGNTRLDRQQVYEQYWAVHGKIAKYELARRKGVEAILARQPLWIFEKLRDEMPAYWAAHGQPIVHLERGAYDDVPRAWAKAAIVVVLAPYLAVLVLFVAGIAALPRGRVVSLLLGFLVYYVLLHVASHGYPRYRLPSLPVVFLLAAHGLCAWHSRPRAPRERRHQVAAALTAVVLALSVGPSLRSWLLDPWPPPWFASSGSAAASTSDGPGSEAP
jgi:4-amino-4-deoxy-L-arabinose transferase-like glycosyltransferase